MQTKDPYLKEIQESLKAMQMHVPLKEIQESLKAMQMHDPLKGMRESLKMMQMHDPLKGMRESLKAVSSFGEFVKELSNDNWSPEIDDGLGIEINADGLIVIDSKSVTQERVQEIAQKVISNALDDKTSVFEQKLDSLLQEIKNLKDPIIQRVIAFLLFPMIVGLVLSVFSPVADYHIKERLSKNEKKLVVEEISRTLTNTFNEQSILSFFRIVSTTSLNVRKKSNSKSDVIAKLHLGDVVEIIEKDKKWFLVIWQDAESGTSVQGWVYSKYLKEII